MEQEKIMTIHCASCGAPAQYDIVKQNYHCPNCGEDTGTEIPLKKAPGVSKSYENIAGAGAPGRSDDRLRVSKLWGTGDCEGTRGNRNLYFLSV